MSSTNSVTFKHPGWKFIASGGDNVKHDPETDIVTISAGQKQDWWRTAVGSVPESGVDRRTGPLYMIRDASIHDKDWTASVWLDGIDFNETFQQAALFVGQGADEGDGVEKLGKWLKFGIELDGGEQKIGAVATNPYSDWSFHTSPEQVNSQDDGKGWKLYVRIKRTGADLLLGYALSRTVDKVPEKDVVPMREVKGFVQQGQPQPWIFGVMACGPQSDATRANFYDFSLSV